MTVVSEPKSLADWISEIRESLVCGRCGKYVGGLGPRRYLPPPYPVALDKIGAADEVEALIGFEAHMISLVKQGKFRLAHPQKDGRCVSFREWAGAEDEDDEPDPEG